MKTKSHLQWLVPLIILLAGTAATFGLFSRQGQVPFDFVTLHGESILMSGRGVYAHDTLFTTELSRGTDMITLIIALPALVLSAWMARRDPARGGLLLTGTLAYFLYYGASLGLGTAYNPIFLVYIALFSVSFYAFVIAFAGYDHPFLAGVFSSRFPLRGLAIFMLIVGVGLAFIWLSDVIGALSTGGTPDGLGPYTTLDTYTLDVGIIAVACVLSGIQILRKAPLGVFLAGILCVMLVLVGCMVVGQTAFQLSAGVPLSPAEIIGKSLSFVIMGGIAAGLVTLLLRTLSGK